LAAERIAAGAGREAVLQALMLLGSILQRAVEGERSPRNAARIVRKVKRGPRRKVRPLAPVTVEKLRTASRERDAVLISVLAYAGLRPQEALALCWGHVRERTILVERAVSLGELKDTKTRAHRTVRLLAPLQEDLRAWRRSQGPLVDDALLFPSSQGRLWTKTDWDNWRRRPFDAACVAIALYDARLYDLCHSFASLLLHEGRSVTYVARQLGHAATLTLNTYGHVIEELDDSPQIAAEDAIRAARNGSCVTGVSQEEAHA
jgi:integrase